MSRRRHPTNPEDSRRFGDWMSHAYVDLLSARMLEKDSRCYAAAAFHCQQCIEKGMKAFILLAGERLVDGHNLTWLCRQCMKEEPLFRQYLDRCITLNRYYIETRYPADVPDIITEKSIRSMVKTAAELYFFIEQQLGEELDGDGDEDAEQEIPASAYTPDADGTPKNPPQQTSSAGGEA